MSLHTLHFDFNHLKDPHTHLMYLQIRGKKYQVQPHHDQSLAEVASINKAAKTLLAYKPTALTHYVDVPAEHFYHNCLTRIQVVGYADASDADNHLPPLYHISYMPHFDDHKKYFKKLVAKKGMLAPQALVAHGLMTVSTDDPWQQLVDQYNLKGPQDVAMYLAGQHPMTMSNKPQTHLAMQNEHVYPSHQNDPDSINQINNIRLLTISIQAQGQPGPNSGFAIVKQSLSPVNQQPLTYGFDVGPRKAGDAVLVYDLTDTTAEWLAPAAALPVQTSRNDPQFQNQTWSVNQGQSSYDTANQAPTTLKRSARAMTAAASGGQWQVSPNTSTHGMTVDQSTVSFDGTNFSVDVYNNFLRIVGAYVEFFSDPNTTTAISNPAGWKENHIPSIFETDQKKYIDMIPNVNTIMGIPMPTDPTNLAFVWPEDAQSAKLLFGGIGTYNYDKNIVWPGFIETGVFQFGIPVFFMAAGAAVTDTQWYKEFIKDTNNIAAAAGLAFSGGSAAFGAYAAVDGLKNALFTFGDILAGMLVSKGFEKLGEYILERLAASEFAEAVPFAGWVIRIASMALDGVEMLVSSGEVLSSPAVIEVAVKRQMTFNFTLHPDPKHGEAGKPETAIWPAVADHYRILVNYKNGTGFEAKGDIPLTNNGGSSNTPVVAPFPAVPWGGSMQIIAAVYSKNGWLCGKYQSDWLDAIPDAATPGIKTVTGNITELLVPLTQDTQYNFMQKIAYNTTDNHYWWGVSKGATIPTDTVSSLNSSNVGNNIQSLTGISINESDYVIGYGWQGSGENIPLENDPTPDSGQMFVFQNLSVLTTPESRLKFPTFGFKTKPGLALDVYGGTEKEIGLLNFVLDTRNDSAGYLRQINLNDGSPTFDLNGGQSFGTFTLGDIDDMVVHPNGYVIAVNWASHRMQILKLADEAVPDANAPAAVVVSNKGIEQGLMLGPIALAISPDGKIMVLESISQRVQAFDIAGNPAPSFSGNQLFTIANAAGLAAELNQKVAPADLIASFITNGASHLFDIDPALGPILDAGVMTQDILDAFSDNMIYLAYITDSGGKIQPDPTQTSFITVVKAGSQWNITDPSRNYTYILTLTNGQISVEDQFNSTEVIVIAKDSSWQLKDLAGAKSYLLNLDGNNLDVLEYLSYFPVNPNNELLTYCDVAIESKGYLYVLAFKGDASKGTIPNDAYVLDVYTPQGAHLFRTPDANISGSSNMQYITAGKIALDIWRNLFSLNYEKLSGPAGRTEPSVSQWTPTLPLFNFAAADAATLDTADMTKIAPLFAAQQITLSAAATCTVVQAGQHWTVNDPTNNKRYDIITSIGGIFVYDIAAS